MTHVTLDPVRILGLDLPAAARRLALSPGGRTLVLTDGLAADTVLLACWNLHADRADLASEALRGALGLAQLAGGPAAALYPHPWREQAVVTAHEDGRGLIYGVDLPESRPLWRVVLDGPLLAELTPHPRGWLACEGPDLLNLFDLDGEEVAQVTLGAAPTSAAVLLPDGRIAVGAHRALLLLDLAADPTPRRVDLPGTPRALAVGPGGALAAALEDAVLLWPDGIEAPPFRAGVGPSQGPLVFSPRGALFVAHPDSGLFLIDPDRQLARRWAEGISCRALRLDHSGAVLAAGTYSDQRSVLLAFPPTPPDATHPIAATPFPLPSPPVDVLCDALGTTLLCEDGTLLLVRLAFGGDHDLIIEL